MNRQSPRIAFCGPTGYLAYLGRISPEKGPARAIAIAERTRTPLKIAAKVSDADREFFRTEIEPLLESAYVEFLGEINDCEKEAFLGDAAALLFPIEWPAPFGLAMIEALACGTPVIAHNRGSVPEVIRHGRQFGQTRASEDQSRRSAGCSNGRRRASRP